MLPHRTAIRALSRSLTLLTLLLLLPDPTFAQDRGDHGNDEPARASAPVAGLEWRAIGPALTSGRISDLAVDPADASTWYVAVASGGVWKTRNAGTTWTPIFDDYGSYSIGCVTVDPANPLTVWVGTGENNSQRSVGYGDGVYRSVDGGRSFRRVGLERSEHVAKILVDPRDSKIVYAAAQGPLWTPGGDRGLFRTRDGGESWEPILQVDENTGVTDVLQDPRNPDVLYAASYQRRRHVWVLIDGGPGSGVWKSTDGGESWHRSERGLPSVDKGRIGLAMSPQDPDVLYAIVEAADGKSGFFRSDDAGEHWSRRSDHITTSPQYYQELVVDPHRFDRVYSLDTRTQVTEDGGRTWSRVGGEYRHVDDHALWIDPASSDHLLIGGDGGLYETRDRGESWQFMANLPVTQFYKLAVDNSQPFFYVYGGTQDNNTQGGPSATTNVHGIRNSDWFITTGGDGFDPAVDPEDPNTVYSQSQYGNLIRYDRRTGLQVDIQPQASAEGPPLRWNWDSALLVSPHSHTRLYFGAQMLFRSDDRGDSWTVVSPDLTRGVDRNRLEVMGRVWSVNAVAKNASTSVYGNIVALTESPVVEGLLYVGTDDGLIQVSEDGGATWRRAGRLSGVPDTSYINDLEADRSDPDVVYAVANNHKRGDFRPYVLRSEDRGRSWRSISGDLPERGSAYTIALDDERPDLLFVGTEFGVYATLDAGRHWTKLKKGMPTIAVRELEVQRRDDALAAASFGRGFYVLDDYAPLRELRADGPPDGPRIFPVPTARMYGRDAPLGGGEKGDQGASFFTAANPPFGAVFTYYLDETYRTRREARREREREAEKKGEDVFYPPWDTLRAEDREEPPAAFLVVRDEDGGLVRRIEASTSRGMHRTSWNFRYPGYRPLQLEGSQDGPLAAPGRYTVSLELRVRGETRELVAPVPFDAEVLGMHQLPSADRERLLVFQRQAGALQRAALGARAAAADAADRIAHVKRAAEVWPGLEPSVRDEARSLQLRLLDLQQRLEGDPTRPSREEPGMPGIVARVQNVVYGVWAGASLPTATQQRNVEIASSELAGIVEPLRQIVEVELPALEDRLDAAGAPWTPGRGVPAWPPR